MCHGQKRDWRTTTIRILRRRQQREPKLCPSIEAERDDRMAGFRHSRHVFRRNSAGCRRICGMRHSGQVVVSERRKSDWFSAPEVSMRAAEQENILSSRIKPAVQSRQIGVAGGQACDLYDLSGFCNRMNVQLARDVCAVTFDRALSNP